MWYVNMCMFPLILFFFLKNVGMFMVTSLEANMSWTLNPLSAIKLSPGLHISFKSLLSAIWRSLVDPQYAGLMKLTRAPGVHPINDFMVFLFLYVEKVACCALGQLGFFIGNSVASEIPQVVGNFNWNLREKNDTLLLDTARCTPPSIVLP